MKKNWTKKIPMQLLSIIWIFKVLFHIDSSLKHPDFMKISVQLFNSDSMVPTVEYAYEIVELSPKTFQFFFNPFGPVDINLPQFGKFFNSGDWCLGWQNLILRILTSISMLSKTIPILVYLPAAISDLLKLPTPWI